MYNLEDIIIKIGVYEYNFFFVYFMKIMIDFFCDFNLDYEFIL